MTRWARKGPLNKKNPLPATKWEDMTTDKEKSAGTEKAETGENDTDIKQDAGSLHQESNRQKSTTSEIEMESQVLAETGKKKRKRDKLTDDRVDSDLPDREDSRKTQKKQKYVQSVEKNFDFLSSDLATALENHDATDVVEEKKEEVLEEFVKQTKGDKRRLKRIDQRQKQMVCFSCRKTGHDVSSCPEVEKREMETGICYRCGSAEHRVSQCRVRKVAQGKFPYANCFICGEVGHISRNCPDNRNGVYPNGGCCHHCGSIFHFQKDCTEYMKKKSDNDLLLKTIDKCRSLDDEPTVIASQMKEKPEPTKRRPKVIKF